MASTGSTSARGDADHLAETMLHAAGKRRALGTAAAQASRTMPATAWHGHVATISGIYRRLLAAAASGSDAPAIEAAHA